MACVLIGAKVAFGATLQVEVTSRYAGEPLQPGTLRYETSAGETFSVTRVSYLLSGFALQDNHGKWLELSNRFAWMDLDAGRSSFRIEDVPASSYRSARFYCGLEPADNHAEAGKFPAGHPMNPNLNGLHWSWQGGYIFMALEGMWRNANGSLDGWAYHLARDTNRVCVNFAVELNFGETKQPENSPSPRPSPQGEGAASVLKLDLDFDVAAVLNAPRALSFGKDGSSTHSRDGDPVAAALVANLPGAVVRREVSVHVVRRVGWKGILVGGHDQPRRRIVDAR